MKQIMIFLLALLFVGPAEAGVLFPPAGNCKEGLNALEWGENGEVRCSDTIAIKPQFSRQEPKAKAEKTKPACVVEPSCSGVVGSMPIMDCSGNQIGEKICSPQAAQQSVSEGDNGA